LDGGEGGVGGTITEGDKEIGEEVPRGVCLGQRGLLVQKFPPIKERNETASVRS